jgi:hypothetical protein
MHYAEKKIKSFTCFLSTILTILTVLCPVTGNSNELNEQQLTNKLFGAVLTNNISDVRLLITQGADINATNQEGLTPAGLAIEKGFYGVAHYIVGIRNQNLMKSKAELPLNKRRLKSKLEEDEINKIRDGKLLEGVNIEQTRKKNIIPVWPEGKLNPFSPTIQTQSPIITRDDRSEKTAIENPQKIKNGVIAGNSGPLKISDMAIPQNKKEPTPLRPIEAKTNLETNILDTIFGKENLSKNSEGAQNSEKLSKNDVDNIPPKREKDLKNKSWWDSITNIF